MRFILFFLSLVSATIKNSQVPLCKNCIHYRPNPFTSSMSKCSQFGNKDVVTGKIKYDYADLSRIYEDKCGLEGKYFNETSPSIKAIQIPLIYPLRTSFIVFLFIVIKGY